MFGKALLLLAAAQGIVVPFGRPRLIEQPRAPIETSGPMWAAQCSGSSDYNKPAPPVRIHANSYLVGTCGSASILIVGDQGHILIDAGTEDGANVIADNIRALGYRVEDIRFILTSNEHFERVGGIAKLQRMSGATVATSAAAAKVIASGTPGAEDPEFAALKRFSPAEVGRLVRDSEELRLGNLMVTAMTTPGTTAGALSWRWVSCDGGVCRTIVYADSLGPVGAETYQYRTHPGELAALRASIAKVAKSPCEILVTAHPSASRMPQWLALGRPVLDPDACRNYAADVTKQLDNRLAKEADQPAGRP